MQDMDRLGCLHPQVLTRVSEHMPEIIAYVAKIVSNGLAYESNSSVYFNTCAFRCGAEEWSCCNRVRLGIGVRKPCVNSGRGVFKSHMCA